jgi:hypothetical protein
MRKYTKKHVRQRTSREAGREGGGGGRRRGGED